MTGELHATCKKCGRIDACGHSPLERIYGISADELGRDEKDEALDRQRRQDERIADEVLRRLEE